MPEFMLESNRLLRLPNGRRNVSFALTHSLASRAHARGARRREHGARRGVDGTRATNWRVGFAGLLLAHAHDFAWPKPNREGTLRSPTVARAWGGRRAAPDWRPRDSAR